MAITVNRVADQPVVSTPASVTTSENASNVALSGMTVTTDGSTSDNADSFSATLSVGNGTLAVGAHGSASLTGSGSGLVTLTGSLTDVNTGLANVSYTATSEFEGTDTLTFSATATDGTSTSTVASSSASITVSPVAEPPSATAPATLTLNENASNVPIPGVSVGPLPENADDTVSANLSVAHGALNVGSAIGVTVSGNNSGALTLTGSATAINTLLLGLTYTPTAEYEGADSLGVVVTSADGSTSANTLALYQFEQGPVGATAGTIVDSSGNNRNGALLAGNPTYSPNVPSQGGDLSLALGTPDAAVFNYPFPFDTYANATLEFLVNPASYSSQNDNVIFWTTTGSGDTNRFNIGIGALPALHTSITGSPMARCICLLATMSRSRSTNGVSWTLSNKATSTRCT